MKNPLRFISPRVAAIGLSTACLLAATPASAEGFSVISSDIREGTPMSKKQEFAGFGCNGGNQSPALTWKNAPVGTKSFAVTAYDPDAPSESGWWHWLVVNLPADTTALPSNAGAANSKLPGKALQTRTDFGSPGFGGACPPEGHGMHRYQFTVWALKVDKLDVDSNTGAGLIGFMLNGNALAKARLTATYSR